MEKMDDSDTTTPRTAIEQIINNVSIKETVHRNESNRSNTRSEKFGKLDAKADLTSSRRQSPRSKKGSIEPYLKRRSLQQFAAVNDMNKTMNPDGATPRGLIQALIPEDSLLGLSPVVRLENVSTLQHSTGVSVDTLNDQNEHSSSRPFTKRRHVHINRADFGRKVLERMENLSSHIPSEAADMEMTRDSDSEGLDMRNSSQSLTSKSIATAHNGFTPAENPRNASSSTLNDESDFASGRPSHQAGSPLRGSYDGEDIGLRRRRSQRRTNSVSSHPAEENNPNKRAMTAPSAYLSKSSHRDMKSTVQNSRRNQSMTEGTSQLKTPPRSSRSTSRSLNRTENTPSVREISARQSRNKTQTLPSSTPGNATQRPDMSGEDSAEETEESYFHEYNTFRTPFQPAETTVTYRNKRKSSSSLNNSSKQSNLNTTKTRAAAQQAVLGGKVAHKRKKKTVADKKLMFRQPKKAILDLMNHFCHVKVSSEAVDEVQLVLDKFWKNLLDDLDMYANHAQRKTIEPCDVELLLRRQRYITADESLNSLIHKYLPLEYQEQLCPIAIAGNTTYVRK